MTRLQFVRTWTLDSWMLTPDSLLPPYPPETFAEYDGRRYAIKPMHVTVIAGRVDLMRRVVLGSGEA